MMRRFGFTSISPRATVLRAAYRWWVVAVALSTGGIVSACRDLTNISNPEIIQTTALDNPQGALVLRAGVLALFANFYGQSVVQSGLISDELTDRTGGTYQQDQRIITQTATSTTFPYSNLSQVRVNAIIAVAAMQRYQSTMRPQIGELFAYAGYVETLFAELMCSGVPLATIVNGRPVAAPPYSTAALLSSGLSLFDSAAAYASSSDSMMSLIQIARARSLLDSGNLVAAAQIAAAVPVRYAYTPPYDGVNQTNAVYLAVVSNLSVSVSDREGQNGLDFRSAADPRVPITGVGVSPFTGDSVYSFATYTSLASPIQLASGVEAKLIVAESLLPINSGSGHAWLDTLNALRTDGTFSVTIPGDTVYNAGEGSVAGLAPLADPLVDSARVSLLFRERALWLFATGHRQGDLRRMIRQYHRDPESVFPTGPYQLGPNRYGTAVAFLPLGEQQANPSFHGCSDIGA